MKVVLLPEQMTPASSPWWHSCVAILMVHSLRVGSLSWHSKSRHIGPLPSPKQASLGALTARPQPSCLHTTLAWSMLQWSSHRVPHLSLSLTSTRPAQLPLLPASLIPSTVKQTISLQYQTLSNCFLWAKRLESLNWHRFPSLWADTFWEQVLG